MILVLMMVIRMSMVHYPMTLQCISQFPIEFPRSWRAWIHLGHPMFWWFTHTLKPPFCFAWLKFSNLSRFTPQHSDTSILSMNQTPRRRRFQHFWRVKKLHLSSLTMKNQTSRLKSLKNQVSLITNWWVKSESDLTFKVVASLLDGFETERYPLVK